MGYLDITGLTGFYNRIKTKFVQNANISNNLTTVTEGKVLDARQGAALKAITDENAAAIAKGASPYTHVKNGTTHNFTGTGKLGYAKMTADFATGDSITINGLNVTVIGDLSEAVTNSNVLFSLTDAVMFIYAVSSPFTVPDGDTTATLNDAGVWLSCAGLNPATLGNPSLSTVAANAGYCETLMNSQNAVNYMLRSNTILTAVRGSATAIAALEQSNPFVSVEMTSNALPNGYTAVANSTIRGAPYKITTSTGGCDNMENFWTAQTVPNWCYIGLPSAVWAYKFTLRTWAWNSNYQYWPYCGYTVFHIQGSNDVSSWTDITATVTHRSYDGGTATVYCTSNTQYKYFRFYVDGKRNDDGGTDAETYWPSTSNFRIYGKKREV